MAMATGDFPDPPGYLWSDAIGWYKPCCCDHYDGVRVIEMNNLIAGYVDFEKQIEMNNAAIGFLLGKPR